VLTQASASRALVWFDIFSLPVVVALQLAMPLSFGVAILRFHLYDIDVIINRALVYSTLSAVLGLIYASLVVLSQLLLRPFAAQSNLAVALSTLTAAALFQPVRGRIQTGVDHRFYRRKYDAARTVERFSHLARQEVDLERLTTELVDVIQDTVQPTQISLWLRR
jgi:hypothetical protein